MRSKNMPTVCRHRLCFQVFGDGKLLLKVDIEDNNEPSREVVMYSCACDSLVVVGTALSVCSGMLDSRWDE
jgi:hypothetical protein